MKQSKLRRRRVIRYAILYFVLLVVFLALIIGPLVAKKQILPSLSSLDDIGGFRLLQPDGQDRDNTNGTQKTGTGAPSYSGYLWSKTRTMTSGADATASATDSSDKIKLF